VPVPTPDEVGRVCCLPYSTLATIQGQSRTRGRSCDRRARPGRPCLPPSRMRRRTDDARLPGDPPAPCDAFGGRLASAVGILSRSSSGAPPTRCSRRAACRIAPRSTLRTLARGSICAPASVSGRCASTATASSATSSTSPRACAAPRPEATWSSRRRVRRHGQVAALGRGAGRRRRRARQVALVTGSRAPRFELPFGASALQAGRFRPSRPTGAPGRGLPRGESGDSRPGRPCAASARRRACSIGLRLGRRLIDRLPASMRALAAGCRRAFRASRACLGSLPPAARAGGRAHRNVRDPARSDRARPGAARLRAARRELKPRQGHAGAGLREARIQKRGLVRTGCGRLRQGGEERRARGLKQLVRITRAKSCAARTNAARALGRAGGPAGVAALRKLEHGRFADEREDDPPFAAAASAPRATRWAAAGTLRVTAYLTKGRPDRWAEPAAPATPSRWPRAPGPKSNRSRASRRGGRAR